MDKQNQQLLAFWAADCAEKVLPFFESKSKDKRPRDAIKECRKWALTGIFSMKVIRGASLAAHAAAKEVEDEKAIFAAHAAGQSVATAHVAEHAFGPAYYSLKIAALDGEKAVEKEFSWLWKSVPKKLRPTWSEWNSKKLPKKLKLEWGKFLEKKRR